MAAGADDELVGTGRRAHEHLRRVPVQDARADPGRLPVPQHVPERLPEDQPASSTAQRRARSEDGEPSMPTTILPPPSVPAAAMAFFSL
jgi:hypothetical protein